MKTVRFGSLEIGKVPRVIGILSSFEALQTFSGRSQDCDIVECRLDTIGHQHDWLSHCQRIQASGTPVILTVRHKSEGGSWTGSEQERAIILKSAPPHVSAIDIELKSHLFSQLSRYPAIAKTPLIVSFHDFEKTPRYDDLQKIVHQAMPQASVVKISTMVRTKADTDVLLKVLQQSSEVPLCIIGMGDLGSRTRADFPALGSCLTYGYLDKPNAPGQLSARALVDHLRTTLPTYNEDWISRKHTLQRA